MCIEDIRLGRESQGFQRSVSVAATMTELLAFNADRKHATISAPATNPMFLSFGVAGGATTGLRIAVGDLPFEVDIEFHGDIVRGPVFAAIPVAGETITAWETILKRE